MTSALLVVVSVAAAYLLFAVWLEQRTRPESIRDAQTTSETGLW